ncbi:peroxidase RIP1-like [Alnus glutinosa]|uniref:peroxidase RIP1-like n=1 Tax=Alnus glutinosa TaxID=3517 RepID=UPI002D7925F4|nr:peroxidase RIP1-like [Alnus glutinosa]
MAAFQSFVVCLIIAFAVVVSPITCAKLSPDFYAKVCPKALPTIRYVLQKAIFREPRIGASLLRLHFHDCFVNGCDGSVLLDDTANFTGEKTAFPNFQSLRGFDVVDEIKTAVNKACGCNVVSCADILAVAARDSVNILGGPSYYYKVLLGRRDARNASWNDANTNLPPPFFNFTQLLSNFQAHGLNLKDLVALSGGHTIGLSQCVAFRARIYNDTNINPAFAASMQQQCPVTGGDNNTESLDATPTRFDTVYFRSLMKSKGLLHSDQELFKGDGSESDNLVRLYNTNNLYFARDFGASMIKMGNIKPLTGKQGEVRLNCRRVN